jgi:hypothetical protein
MCHPFVGHHKLDLAKLHPRLANLHVLKLGVASSSLSLGTDERLVPNVTRGFLGVVLGGMLGLHAGPFFDHGRHGLVSIEEFL